jgi:hypothetical protein
VVYGGTAGGVIAAVSAARQGLKTALVEPTGHLGGMVSGGLSWTDYGKKEVIGGYALEFYWRAGVHYQMSRYGNEVSWLHEPRVAETIFRDMLTAAGVQLFERQRLREKDGVRKNGATVAAFTTEDGTEFTAAIFIDAGYEGDLMAQSGVTWTYGREGASQYGETLAGVREKTPLHQFLVDVAAKDASGKLLPEISAATLDPAGALDKKVQAYNYRMCFSDLPENRRAWSKPANYNAARYALLPRLIAAQAKKEGHTPPLSTYLKIDRIMNNKADVNNNGAVSTDYIGGSYDYPTASYARRSEIWQAHRDYIAGLFYFMATDPQIPEALRRDMNQWGLCRDEFVDNDNWPTQLYIREARRMVGEYVVVQKDLQTDLTKPDPIGMGSYNSDSHNIQRIVDAEGFVRNEGDMQVAVKPYQIPYRVMLPKRAEARNLLVTAAFSASHVAYSSIRMEPQYMIIGQAAGVAAKLAIAGKTSVQEIDTLKLTGILKQEGAVMEYVPNANAPILQIIRRPGIR